jgi:hypothetical protein
MTVQNAVGELPRMTQQSSVDAVLDRFMRSGEIVKNSVRSLIAESWMRCREDGAERDAVRTPSSLAPGVTNPRHGRLPKGELAQGHDGQHRSEAT